MKNAILIVCFVVGASSAQTRQWGFNKDTVYETIYGPGDPIVDSLVIFNNSPDTLRFDTATISLYDSGFQASDIQLDIGNEVGITLHSSDAGVPSYGIKQFIVPPNSNKICNNIVLSFQSPSDKDTLTMQVVFYSVASSDTVYVRGDALGCCLDAVRNPVQTLHLLPLLKAIPRDINGRAVTYPNSTTILKATNF